MTDAACARCAATDIRLVESYWGHHLCARCCVIVARLMDVHGTWPPVPWNDDDLKVIAGNGERNAR